MTSTVLARGLVSDARAKAFDVLTGVGRRWDHTVGVARRAEELAGTVPRADRELLIAAAWLHDIGYAPETQDTGFHPLDGAWHLRRAGWDHRLTALVAHHSGATHSARIRGMDVLLAEFPDEASPVSDALTHADQTTGPDGSRLPVTERIALALRRHGPGSVFDRARPVRVPAILATAGRVERRLQATRFSRIHNPPFTMGGSIWSRLDNSWVAEGPDRFAPSERPMLFQQRK